MNKQPQVTALTRQNLVDAFWSLYCGKRIEKITIKEITARAGYNRGTFYEYFMDAYDVLEQIENDLLARLQELHPPSHSAASAMMTSLSFAPLIQMFQEYGKYFVVLLGDHGDPSFIGKLKASFKPAIKTALVELGAADDFELDYTLEYLLSAMIGIMTYWCKQATTPPMDQLLALMNDLVQEGVSKKLHMLQRKE